MNEIQLHHRHDVPVTPTKRTSKCRGNPRQKEVPSIEDKYTLYNLPNSDFEVLDYFDHPELWIICHGVLNDGVDAEAAAAAAMIAPIRPFKKSIVAAARAKLKRHI